MALFFVTGPVSVGKANFAQTAAKIMKVLGRDVLVCSIGDARKLYTNELNVSPGNMMRETPLDAMRAGIVDTLAVNTMLELAKRKFDDIVITLPLGIMNSQGAISDQVSAEQLDRLIIILKEHHGQKLAHFTCLIDDPRVIMERMKSAGEAKAYAGSVVQLLEWTSMEVLLTQIMAQRFGADWCVLPATYSNASLAKIIYDFSEARTTHITYVAHPISELLSMKSGRDYKKLSDSERAELAAFARACEMDIKDLKRRLQNSTIVISPIELAKIETDVDADSLFGTALRKSEAGLRSLLSDDSELLPTLLNAVRSALSGTIFEALRQHTIYRDLYWFVRKVCRVVAYYPAKITSPGADSEVSEALALGRRVVLVKDSRPLPTAKENLDKEAGTADSPFYVEKSLETSDIFNSSDSFVKSEEPRYKVVEDAYKELKVSKG